MAKKWVGSVTGHINDLEIRVLDLEVALRNLLDSSTVGKKNFDRDCTEAWKLLGKKDYKDRRQDGVGQ